MKNQWKYSADNLKYLTGVRAEVRFAIFRTQVVAGINEESENFSKDFDEGLACSLKEIIKEKVEERS